MCSIGEDDFGDEGGKHAMKEHVELSQVDKNGVCKKCAHIGLLYKLQCREEECQECFLSYVRHKFRATLGSSKVLPKDAQVLLLFDGSAASIVLLDMLHFAQTQNRFKRLHCNTCVLVIDEGLLDSANESVESNQKHIYALRDFLTLYGEFEAYITSLSDPVMTIFSFENIDKYLNRNISSELEFSSRISKFESLTSRQDFLKHYQSHIIAKIATELKCNFAFLPDISTNLAAQLLSAITLGRGGCAALDVALVDNRLDDKVKLIRPLKDLNRREVDLYLQARNLNQFEYKKVQCPPAEDSLQNLTNAFVENLQKNFPATVSTIFRTGDKILPNRKIEQRLDHISSIENEHSFDKLLECTFCKSPLDFVNSNTLLAVEFSRLVSKAGNMPMQCKDLDLEARRNVNEKEHTFLKQLCHACQNLHFDSGGSNSIINQFL